MTYIFEALLETLKAFLVTLADILLKAIDANPWLLLPVLAGVFIWVFTAGLASSLAEKQKRSPKLHFLVGLMLPVLYGAAWAVYCARIASRQPSAVAADQPLSAEEAQPGNEANLNEPADESSTESEPQLDQAEYGKAFFVNLQEEPPSGASGWYITFGAITIYVVDIVEALPEAVAVKFRDKAGNTKSMRIPYSRISNVRRADAEDST